VISTTFVHRGRTITVPVPEKADMPEDDRCEECRAAGIANCTHHGEPHVHTAPTSPQTDATATEQHHMPMPMPAEEHEHDSPQDHPAEVAHEGHMGHIPIEISVDGRTFPGHINRKGQFHSHELPFMVFPTAEALGRAIANKLDWSEPHGSPPQSETAEQS
jgi:hypothetical protein